MPFKSTTWQKNFTYLDATLDWASNPAWSCGGRSQSPIAIDTATVQRAPVSVISELERAFIAALPRGLMGNVSNLTLANKCTFAEMIEICL